MNVEKDKNILSESSKKTDLRVIKTKRAIDKALSDLLQKKSINKITVAELSEKAEINKGTFYLHYVDIYDLYQHALKDHLIKMVDRIDFMDQFFTDPDKFSRNLITNSINNPIFIDDHFFSSDNAKYSQSGHFYFCNALVSKVLSTNKISATKENEVKLKFIFFGAGSLLRYDSQEDAELIINAISNTIKNLFPMFNNNQQI